MADENLIIDKLANSLSSCYLSRDSNLNSDYSDLSYSNDNGRMTYLLTGKMETQNNIYSEIISLKNLILAYKKAKNGKTKKYYVKKFEENLAYNLKILHEELENQT